MFFETVLSSHPPSVKSSAVIVKSAPVVETENDVKDLKDVLLVRVLIRPVMGDGMGSFVTVEFLKLHFVSDDLVADLSTARDLKTRHLAYQNFWQSQT